MSNQPFFSIIIPTYNRAHVIKRTIEHVLTNEFTDFELIIVDDGSTDNTREIVENVHDSRVKYYWKENGERGAARNFGLGKARGEFINYFDSDDVQYSNHLAEAFSVIKSNSIIKVFHLSYETETRYGKKAFHINVDVLNDLLITNNVISINGMFIHKDIAKHHKFDEDRNFNFAEDYYLWLSIIPFYKIIHHNVVTHCIKGGDNRSMACVSPEKVKYFIEKFKILACENRQYFNDRRIKLILANHYNVASQLYLNQPYKSIIKSIKCLAHSVVLNPKLIYRRRSIYTMKKLLFA